MLYQRCAVALQIELRT